MNATGADLKAPNRSAAEWVLQIGGSVEVVAGGGVSIIERPDGLPRTAFVLDETKISDQGLQHLAGLKKLKNLNLKQTGVAREWVQRLQKALPECTITTNMPDKDAKK